MGAVYVPLSVEAVERLKSLARQERRRPQDQAALLLERALGAGGADSQAPRQAGEGG